MPQQLHHCTFLPAAHKHPILLYPHQELLFPISVFSYSHPNGCEVVSQCGFNLRFSSDWWCWHLFMCLLHVCASSLEKCLLKSFGHFGIVLVWFWFWFRLSCRVLYMFWILVLYHIYNGQIFSPILWNFSHFVHSLDCVLWCRKSYNFYENRIHLFFLLHVCGVIKIIVKSDVDF